MQSLLLFFPPCIVYWYFSRYPELTFTFPAEQEAAPPGVTVSRGSDIMPMARVRRSSVEVSETGELKFEEAEELDVGDANQVIIYLPPSQDDFDSEVARSEIYRDYRDYRDYFLKTAKWP